MIAPLTQILKNGDRVEILTTKQGHPSRDWLSPAAGYLKTTPALTKVRHWFKQEDHEENLEAGHELWEKTFRRAGVPKNALNTVYEKFNFKSVDDLFAAIGARDIGIATVLNKIRGPSEYPDTIEQQLPIKKATSISQKKSGSFISIEGVGNLLTQLARCCEPIPGDPITGYITKGRGISIHQTKCHNIKQALKFRKERVIEVNWGEGSLQQYPVNLSIEADDRPGLIRDISNLITHAKIPILGLNTRVNKLNNHAHISVTIEINDLKVLDKIMLELNKIPNVISVDRKK